MKISSKRPRYYLS